MGEAIDMTPEKTTTERTQDYKKVKDLGDFNSWGSDFCSYVPDREPKVEISQDSCKLEN